MYYSQIRVDPTNPDIAYQGGAPFFKTIDGGKTWRQVQGLAHSDHHAIWIDPRDHNHLMVGNDGGLDVSYDQAETWEFVNSLGAVGQFYKVSADMRKPYVVCGGLQDNGSWCGPSGVRSQNGILNSDWYRVGGGDGFYTANDPTDWRILYSESQDGATQPARSRPRHDASASGRAARPGAAASSCRRQRRASTRRSSRSSAFGPGAANGNIVPPPPPGTNFRFYWNTPFMLSPHNPSTIYLGAERVFKSMDRGNTWMMSAGSDAQHRPQRSADHGSRRQGADGLEARRRGRLQQRHHHQRVARSSRASSGRAPTTATCRSAATAA